ncbi:hypothetical protein IV203_021695 [Nitzschia inconspicua]|uniref:Uncharacterized protein n=1 Tax=Nitzschia inconspicua TaxID=303405 RepID=A0A9K3KHH0_9STRA|nr:hypothetical protein IV203_021695 [Nitzschia inconspicua]
MDANDGNPKHNESINNRKRTIEEVEVFLVPSSGDELFDRVWAEASLSSSSLQNDDHSSSSVRDGIRQLCHDFMPCNTLQRYNEIVNAARKIIQARQQARLEARRRMSRKVRNDFGEISVAALMELKEGDVQLQHVPNGKGFNHIRSGLVPVKGLQQHLNLKPIPLDDVERRDISSSLMMVYLEGNKAPLREYDMDYLIPSMLGDALRTCNRLLRKFRPRDEHGETMVEGDDSYILRLVREPTLWRERLVNAAVYDRRCNVPLLLVERKDVFAPSSNPTRYAQGLSEVYDDLRLMQLMGHHHPIHVASSIEETFVTWLEGNQTMQEYGNSSDARACWTAAANKVFKKLDMEQLTQRPVGEQTEQPTDASVSKASPVSEELLSREVVHTQTFRLHQMFHVFVDAILYAVLGAYSSPTLPTLKTGEQIHRQLAWKLKNDSCQWVLISATVKGPLPSRKQWSISQTLRNGVTVLSTVVGGSSPCLYAVSAVGSGATSIVYRVITEEGYEGVAKVYTGALENERANRLTDIERKVFNATYPQVPVSKLTVDCYPILLMPYFEHIKQPDETWKEKVMAALRELKGGRARHLKYTDCDVCWRHIGLCRESGQIRLFDFNNMEVIQPTNRIEQEVERQWEILAGYIQQNTEK